MRIASVLCADDLRDDPADVVVLPEGTSWQEILLAQEYRSNAIVVGAVLERGSCSQDQTGLPRCRAILLHQGCNLIEYLKVGTDGFMSRGADRTPTELPIVHFDAISIAVLVCMDLQEWPFSHDVIEALRSSKAGHKLLCVPSAMTNGSGWSFDDVHLSRRYAGIHLVLSNHTRQESDHRLRIRNFITDPIRQAQVRQRETEPIFFEL